MPKKKKLEKWPFFGEKHGLSPLEKCQFFDFLNFFFDNLEISIFVVKYRKKYFPGLYCLKKMFEKWPFSDQNRGLISRYFRLLVFRAWKGVFSF